MGPYEDKAKEMAFQIWYGQRAKNTGTNPDPDNPYHYYDYRGAWEEGYAPTGHLPDTYKLPGHPTFSVESKYYRPGMRAGKWEEETFIPFSQWATKTDKDLANYYDLMAVK